MLSKAKHKTRLAQHLKAKHTNYAKQKHKQREECDRITWSHFPSTHWKNISFKQTLEPVVRGKN